MDRVIFEYSKLRGKIREVFGSEREFALKLGISDVTLSNIFNNKAEFRQIQIHTACQLLGIKSEEIDDYFFCIVS